MLRSFQKLVARVEDIFQVKDDELSSDPFEGYMLVEYEAFKFCKDNHQEESMNQACVNIDEYLMTSAMDMEIKDRLQVREDDT